MHIVNVVAADAPFQTGKYDAVRSAVDVAVSDKIAYLADSYEGLHIVDVADPAAPGKVGLQAPPWNPWSVSVDGEYAFVAAGDGGFLIINVADPAAPTEAGAYAPPGSAKGVAVVGKYAYVAAENGGLRIIDITDLANLDEIGYLEGFALNVTVNGNYAYVADQQDFSIVDVTIPDTPVRTSSYDTPGLAYSVAVHENFAYFADGGEGLRVIDVADPFAPFEVGYYNLPGDARDVALDENFVYVGSKWGGLTILRFTGPTPRGRIIVDKVTEPGGDPKLFGFVLAYGPADPEKWGFFLTDTSDPWDSGGLLPGSYMVVETVPDGWIQQAAVCDNGSDPSDIQLEGGETVTCTFTNKKLISPTADFSASPGSGAPPLTVDFTNLSTGDFDQCRWDFGDGGTSAICDAPAHEYRNEGHYTVGLTVKGLGGEDTLSVEQCISVAFYRRFLLGVLGKN